MTGVPPIPPPATVVRRLRDTILTLRPEDIGVTSPGERGDVWAILMEMGYPEGLVALLALADGTTSLYWGHGGGVIGAGEHESVRRASAAFLAAAERARPRLHTVEECPLPGVGRVRFYCRTFAGTLGGEAAEDDVGAGTHPLTHLFQAGHSVITAIRHVDGRAETDG